MRLNVKQLTAAAEQASERLREQHQQRLLRQRAEAEEKAADWVQAYADQWDAAALEIRKKVRKSWPILAQDLPQDRQYRAPVGGRIAVYEAPRLDGEHWQEPAALSSLRAVLAVLADDTVTVAALRDLGVNAEMLRQVVSHLRAQSVTATKESR